MKTVKNVKKSMLVPLMIVFALLPGPPSTRTGAPFTDLVLGATLMSGLPGLSGVLHAQPARPAQEEFVPIDQLPPEEQLAAAPLLVAAYGFVWLALLFYVWSLWRRMGRVERELADVGRRAGGKGRGA